MSTLHTKKRCYIYCGELFISEEQKFHKSCINNLKKTKEASKAITELNEKDLVLIEEFDTKYGKDVYAREHVMVLPVTTLRVL